MAELQRRKVSPGRTIARPAPSRSSGHIANYCCFLQSSFGANGSGFIVEFEDLQNSKLLALDWEKRKRKGKLQTNYALVTSHDTIPGSSCSELKGWKVSCQGIKNGKEQTLSNLVCGVISCCGTESLFDPGHSDAKIFLPHPNAGCKIQLNITILFLNSTFEKLLQGVRGSSGCTVSPPVISVQKCLNQEAYAQEYKEITSRGKGQSECTSTPFHVYYCSGVESAPQAIAVSLIEKKKNTVFESQDTSEPERVINREITKYRKFRKVSYRESSISKVRKPMLSGKCYGSPMVYHNPDANEFSVIGVHVGQADQEGEYIAVTFHEILRLFQGLLSFYIF